MNCSVRTFFLTPGEEGQLTRGSSSVTQINEKLNTAINEKLNTASSLSDIKVLITEGASIDDRDVSGLLAFYRAAHVNGKRDIAQKLLENGKVLEVHKNKALHLAATEGHIEVVKVLLNHKVNVNNRISEITAINRAYVKGHNEIVKLLTKHKAEPAGSDYSSKKYIERQGLNPPTVITPFNNGAKPVGTEQLTTESSSAPAGETSKASSDQVKTQQPAAGLSKLGISIKGESSVEFTYGEMAFSMSLVVSEGVINVLGFKPPYWGNLQSFRAIYILNKVVDEKLDEKLNHENNSIFKRLNKVNTWKFRWYHDGKLETTEIPHKQIKFLVEALMSSNIPFDTVMSKSFNDFKTLNLHSKRSDQKEMDKLLASLALTESPQIPQEDNSDQIYSFPDQHVFRKILEEFLESLGVTKGLTNFRFYPSFQKTLISSLVNKLANNKINDGDIKKDLELSFEDAVKNLEGNPGLIKVFLFSIENNRFKDELSDKLFTLGLSGEDNSDQKSSSLRLYSFPDQNVFRKALEEFLQSFGLTKELTNFPIYPSFQTTLISSLVNKLANNKINDGDIKKDLELSFKDVAKNLEGNQALNISFLMSIAKHRLKDELLDKLFTLGLNH